MGRHVKPAALKRLQGNPGNRPLPKEPRPRKNAKPIATSAVETMPFVKLSDDAKRAYEIVATSLRGLNFVQASDEPLLLRYSETLARYWRVTHELDRLGGETYECITTTGEKMLRMRPQFVVQDRLARRLEPMEDRLGLSPAARQQYLQRMMNLGSQPQLPGMPQDGSAAPDERRAPPPQTMSGPVGSIPRDALN